MTSSPVIALFAKDFQEMSGLNGAMPGQTKPIQANWNQTFTMNANLRNRDFGFPIQLAQFARPHAKTLRLAGPSNWKSHPSATPLQNSLKPPLSTKKQEGIGFGQGIPWSRNKTNGVSRI